MTKNIESVFDLRLHRDHRKQLVDRKLEQLDDLKHHCVNFLEEYVSVVKQIHSGTISDRDMDEFYFEYLLEKEGDLNHSLLQLFEESLADLNKHVANKLDVLESNRFIAETLKLWKEKHELLFPLLNLSSPSE